MSQDRFVPEFFGFPTSLSLHQVQSSLIHHQRYTNNALKNINRLDEPSIKPGKETRYRYISSTNRPESLLFHEYRGSFPVMKRPGRDVDPSPKSSVQVKNEWSYTTTPRIRLHGVDRERMQLKVVTVSLEAVSRLLTGVAADNHTEPHKS